VSDERAESLVADCANCVGLCCVALAFVRSADFGFDKDAGEECRNLVADYRCSVHPTLRADGFKGCTVFDCHGAGQKVTQVIFAQASWRDSSSVADAMFAVFRVVRQLHEMLWYLSAAERAAAEPALRTRADAMYTRVEGLTELPGDRILALDLDAIRDEVNPILSAVSESVRAESSSRRPFPIPAKLQPGADLVGGAFPGRDLRGSDLRGALLIAADLSGADLRGSDLLAADLRDAKLEGADLSTTLFVTQMQLNAASGDGATRIPTGTVRPAHWI
jgi:hypothetical protein